MKTKAVRLYGENDVRLEEFELPELKDGEILIKIRNWFSPTRIASFSAGQCLYHTDWQSEHCLKLP